MSKSDAMMIAALLTVAACAARGTPANGALSIDPLNNDPNQRNLDLQTWEIFRAFYFGVVGASSDEKDFPSPPAPAKSPSLPSGIAAALQLPSVASGLAGNTTFGPLVTALANAGIQLAAQAVQQAIPGPGVSAAPTAAATATAAS